MKQIVILSSLRESKFKNWQNWSEGECKDYIKSNYSCSDYIAKEVAKEIINW